VGDDERKKFNAKFKFFELALEPSKKLLLNVEAMWLSVRICVKTL